MATDDEELRKNWPELRAKFAGYTFYHYREYVQRTTKLIEQEKKLLDRRLDEARMSTELGPDVKGIVISRCITDLQWFTFHFHRIAYRSVFISVYSQFERAMIEFCDDTQKARKCKIGVDDLGAADIIGRCRKYLIKVGELAFPDDKGWDDIKRVQKIRNRIVHGAGVFKSVDGVDTPETEELRQFIWKNGGLTESLHTIDISEQFLLYTVDLFSGFLIELVKVTPTD